MIETIFNSIINHKNSEYSVVVPIYNEQGNVHILDKEIKQAMNKISKSYEIIYVNDGSTDKTLNKLKKLKALQIKATDKLNKITEDAAGKPPKKKKTAVKKSGLKRFLSSTH